MQMPNWLRFLLISGLKLVIFTALVYAVLWVTVQAFATASPSPEKLCDRIQPGMTVEQVDKATNTVEGWKMLRHDNQMAISARSSASNSPVCRVDFDPQTHRVVSKKVGPVIRGDWPTL